MSGPYDGPNYNLRERIERVEELPPLPEIGARLLRLKDDPRASTRQLAGIIELDPSLAGQIMRYAASPFLGYREKIASIQEAITRLGFDKVADLALGFAAGSGFSIPATGPIGLQAFWQHAIHSASLMQGLAEQTPPAVRVRPGIAYLAGLLKNIGFPLLGHLFPEEFQALNRAIAAQPDRAVTELEQEVIAVDHTDSGVWLMRKWRMPSEIITTVFEHHNADYRGEHHAYANLALVADRLLKRYGIGDAFSEALPERLLDQLGLTEPQARHLAETFMNNSGELNGMAEHMAKAAAGR